MEEFVLTQSYITLGRWLKLSGLIATGGGAKAFLQEEHVTVNGQVEVRRGRKLVPGDVITVKERKTMIVVDGG